MRRRHVILFFLAACSSSAAPTPAPAPAAPLPTAVTRAPTAPTPAAQPAASIEAAKVADDDLKTEEREANPYSENVTLKLSVSPPVKALVTWGIKTMARLSPGSMDAEIERPRGSGPVDLEIKADGYLPSHTRLYADRSDKVSVRLYRNEEAPGLFGYKRSADKLGDKKK